MTTSDMATPATPATPAAVAPVGRPRGADLRLLGRQIVAEQKMFWRNPAAAGFTFVFPIMFLVIFSALSGNSPVDTISGKVGYATYYLPGIVGYSVLTACFSSLAMSLIGRRENGIFKRKRGTPLPTWAMLGGILGSQFVVTVVLTVLTTAVSLVAFDVPFPEHVATLIGVVLLGAACFCALGMAITLVIPNEDAAPAIINIIMFPLLFLSGTFFPITNDTLNRINDVLPIARLQHALFDSYAPPVRTAAGVVHASGPSGGDLLVLAIWFAVGVLLALGRFRWEPRNR